MKFYIHPNRTHFFVSFKVIFFSGTSLVVQWLRLHASTAGGMASNPGQRTRKPYAVQCSQKKKKESYFFLSSLSHFSSLLYQLPLLSLFQICMSYPLSHLKRYSVACTCKCLGPLSVSRMLF